MVSVSLASGRTLRGAIDPRSDDAHLWLVRGDAQASITRPIAWSSIESAEHDKLPLTMAELQTIARDVAAKRRVEAVADVNLPAWRGVFASAPPAPTSAIEHDQVRSLAINAYHANWDNDIESDGLVIEVLPLDRYGQVVPVTGSLEVELIAPEVRRFHDAPHGRGLTLERIGNWTATVHNEDFVPSGARIELPFQAVHPEFDTKILPHGLVHARLVVPGQGTFDTSDEFIRLRPWSPLRDKYWRDTGRRFFPNEQTGRGQRSP